MLSRNTPKHPLLFVVMQVPLPTVRMVAAMPTVVSGMSVEKTVATSSTQSRNQPQKQKKDQKQTSKGSNFVIM